MASCGRFRRRLPTAASDRKHRVRPPLPGHERRVAPVALHELLVGAELHDLSAVEHGDLVGIGRR